MWHNYAVLPFTSGMRVLLAVLIIWTLVWKGIALWKAARNSHKAWYVVMLIVNTVGILEIIYIFGFSKSKHSHNA
ncbi:hypothetical protein KGQ24_01235 [Patescibacteria group bacterium]|nr:hypothetical protein [Patescibacteria group bacterium]